MSDSGGGASGSVLPGGGLGRRIVRRDPIGSGRPPVDGSLRGRPEPPRAIDRRATDQNVSTLRRAVTVDHLFKRPRRGYLRRKFTPIGPAREAIDSQNRD